MRPLHPSPPAERRDYEVDLVGAAPAALRAAFPNAVVRCTTETVLRAEVKQGTELDILLDKLLSMGLILTELHERPTEPGSEEQQHPPRSKGSVMTTRMYDVRVEGELGEPLLRYLDCPHHVEPTRTVVRLDAVTASELDAFVRACRDVGLEIERVREL